MILHEDELYSTQHEEDEVWGKPEHAHNTNGNRWDILPVTSNK